MLLEKLVRGWYCWNCLSRLCCWDCLICICCWKRLCAAGNAGTAHIACVAGTAWDSYVAGNALRLVLLELLKLIVLLELLEIPMLLEKPVCRWNFWNCLTPLGNRRQRVPVRIETVSCPHHAGGSYLSHHDWDGCLSPSGWRRLLHHAGGVCLSSLSCRRRVLVAIRQDTVACLQQHVVAGRNQACGVCLSPWGGRRLLVPMRRKAAACPREAKGSCSHHSQGSQPPSCSRKPGSSTTRFRLDSVVLETRQRQVIAHAIVIHVVTGVTYYLWHCYRPISTLYYNAGCVAMKTSFVAAIRKEANLNLFPLYSFDLPFSVNIFFMW